MSRSYSSRRSSAGAAAFGILCLGILEIIAIQLLNGFTLQHLWSWFVVPKFHGIPSLNIREAIGIALVVRFLTWQMSSTSEENKKSLVESFGLGLAAPILALVFGYIIYSF